MGHSSSGRMKAKLPANKCQEENDCTLNMTSMPCLETKARSRATKKKSTLPSSKRATSVTPVSRVRTNEKTSSVKSATSKKPSQTIPLSKTLGPDSTSKERDLLPFWNKYTQALSEKWSFKTATDCVVTDMNWSNGSSRNLTQQSWFTVKCRQVIPQVILDPEQQKEQLQQARRKKKKLKALRKKGKQNKITAKKQIVPLATNLPTISSPLSPSLLREIMVNAQAATDVRENKHKAQEAKSKQRKQTMHDAQQKKKLERISFQMEIEEAQMLESSEKEEISQSTDKKMKETNKKKRTRSVSPTQPSTTPIHSARSLPDLQLPQPPPTKKVKKTNNNPSTETAKVLKKPIIANDPNKPPPCRVRKYKLNPTSEQLELLRRTFGVTTWTYNQSVAAIQAGRVQPTVKDLRNFLVNKSADLLQDKPWVTNVPYDLRDEAVKDFIQAWKANETKKKKGDVRAMHAQFKFQNKYRPSRKLVIHAKHYWAAGIFHPGYFGEEPFRCQEGLPDKLSYDATLTLDWLGQVHLHVPGPLDKKVTVDNLPYAPNPIVAIDQGVRTAGTLFDPTNQRYIEWGSRDMAHIYRLHHYMDDLRSRMQSTADKPVGHHRRWRMKRAWRRMSVRIQNMVKDFHFKYAKWLCENYQVILLPYYDVRQMVRKTGTRVIRKQTVRAMMAWASCTFRDRLIGMSRRYPGCHIIQLSEAYTSKCCRVCGFLHRKLGGNKVFACPSCSARYPRDDGGASNIFLRYMTMLKLDKQVDFMDTNESCVDSVSVSSSSSSSSSSSLSPSTEFMDTS